MADGRLRALVATASLDLGVDWGDVDLVVQMGAPKGASRLLQRIGRANHRLDEPSKALIVPGNRFEYLEARAALDAVEAGERDPDVFRPGSARRARPAHHGVRVAPRPSPATRCSPRCARPRPMPRCRAQTFDRVLGFVATGGYALKAYDRYKRLTEGVDGLWRVSHPRFVTQHRLNAGIIVEAPMLTVRFRNGRSLGKVEEAFAASLSPHDTFFFSGPEPRGGGGRRTRI